MKSVMDIKMLMDGKDAGSMKVSKGIKSTKRFKNLKMIESNKAMLRFNMTALLLAIILFIPLWGSVSAASSMTPTFKVDGRLFITPDGEPAPYFNKDNRTMGSLRLIGAALGVESKYIKWDKAKQTATLVRGNNTVSVTVGKKAITVNGKSVTMDTVAEVKQGRVFIPARFIAQGLGVKLGFDSKTNTVSFYTGNEVVNNNFADYGLTVVNPLPITLEVNGLAITYEEAFLYKVDSAEAKALHDKYQFITMMYEKPDHLLWLKVTIKNTSIRTINSNHLDIEPKIEANYAFGSRFNLEIANDKNQWIDNGGDYLHYWSVEPNKSISGYVALTKAQGNVDFISFKTVHREKYDLLRIAE